MRGGRMIACVAVSVLLAVPRLTAQASRVDPCSLLTAAEVSAVLHITSLPGRPFLGSKTVCIYSADTSNTIGEASVTLMVMSRAAFENGKVLDASIMHPASGIGDDAYAVGSGSYLKLGVLKGNQAFSVTVVPGEKNQVSLAQLQQMEEQLAKNALARL